MTARSGRYKKLEDPQAWIQYEDDDYLVINKPAFIATLDDRNDPENVLSTFREMYLEMYVCHRLDKETSGALLLAKNADAYRHASLQFENREVEKVYHALVNGQFMDDVIKVDMPLKVTGSGKVRVDSRQGKEAETLFRTKETYGRYTLLEAKPISGRRHQIRVHLAYINFPICGDAQYGGDPIYLSDFKKYYRPSNDRNERPLFDRVALHAHSINFATSSGKQTKVICEYPKDIDMILKKIKKFGL